ncbi:hypothetical protein DPMN_065916 [Dreissena polymorpha]|uniref:Uncharacterized protein n=1 Tax=Dreissena polymorpha TaxID=45954 RepID=A0A9D3YY11_DREPO|nr:hypothetical protein DPMN_065916 [Dreissena polymorpha]
MTCVDLEGRHATLTLALMRIPYIQYLMSLREVESKAASRDQPVTSRSQGGLSIHYLTATMRFKRIPMHDKERLLSSLACLNYNLLSLPINPNVIFDWMEFSKTPRSVSNRMGYR